MIHIHLGIENEKGELDSSPFCPKSTINLTYLCYGESNISAHYFKYSIFWTNDLYISLRVETTMF
jgi:hypothetical protein